MKVFIFTWSIENITYSWHKSKEKIISPKFFASPIQNSVWTLRLYPRGFENSDYFSLFLRRESDSAPENLAVNFELSCISADTSSLQSCFFPENIINFTKGEELGFGVLRFLSRHEVFDRKKALYLPQDTLTLRCKMWIESDDEEFVQSFESTRLMLAEKTTVKEIQKYHIHEILSDFENKVLIQIIITLLEDKLSVEIIQMNKNLMKFMSLNLSLVDKSTKRKLCEHEIVRFDGMQKETIILPFSGTLQHTENDESKERIFDFITHIVYSTGEEKKGFKIDYLPIIPKFISDYIKCSPSGKQKDDAGISVDLWNLYKNQTFCDIELKTIDGSIFAHKFILCSRSSVFCVMLKFNAKEKESGCVEIEDISAETLKKFLIFLYTDAFEEYEWDEVTDLYYAADKYQVERLKLLCSSYLIKNFDVDNVCAALVMADNYNDCDLRQKSNDFIWKNDEIVFRSSSWKEVVQEKPDLALKTMNSKDEDKENHCTTTIFDKISSLPKLFDDIRSMYQTQFIGDILINTARASFPAYKAVLCATSSVFKVMLSKDLRYRPIDFIQIDGIEDETVSTMLLFLHTDSLDAIEWEAAKKLYHAACVYEIDRLKLKCSCYLLENLRVSNACNLLLLAHEHSDVPLKSAVEDYIFLYDDEIFGSDVWDDFFEANSRLAFETMRSKYRSI